MGESTKSDIFDAAPVDPELRRSSSRTIIHMAQRSASQREIILGGANRLSTAIGHQIECVWRKREE